MSTLGILVLVILSVLLGLFLRSVIYYATQSAREGKTAPAFYARMLDGTNVGTTSWDKPKHPIILVFVSHKCSACRNLSIALDGLKKRFPNSDIDVILLGMNGEASLFAAWREQLHIDLPVALDPEGVSAKRYGVYSVPAAYYISTQGLIRWTHRGFRQGDEEFFEKAFRRRRRILRAMRRETTALQESLPEEGPGLEKIDREDPQVGQMDQ